MTGMFLALLGGKVQIVTDPYFEYTTLLLPGNGTNGAQNNTFLDASTNNFTITRNGNTTQGTFSPFSQTGWGNYFDGSSYLSFSNGAALAAGTSNFTAEFWVYATTDQQSQVYGTVFHVGSGSAGCFLIALLYSSAGAMKLRFSTSTTDYDSTSTIAPNRWYHIAFVREGTGSNQTKCYVDGSLFYTFTLSDNLSNSSGLYVGATAFGLTVRRLSGYVSNLRYTVGTALYTTAFTPSTSPLTTTSQGATASQVELLTCQNNRFLDNSSNAWTVTTSGSPSVQAFSPFNPTSSWSATTNGGSGYFDGSGDYLTVGSGSSELNLNSDSSIELWFYPTSASSGGVLTAKYGAGTNQFYINSDTANKIYVEFLGSTYYAKTSSTSYVRYAWNHLLITKSSTTAKMWLNGVYEGTWTVSSINSSTNAIGIGATSTGVSPFFGYISSLRYSNIATETGTSNITVPSAPLTSTANTVGLLNFTNAGIYDATSKNDLETVGNAQISTAQSKWGGSSMAFDGTGDYLQAPDTELLEFGSGDFTIETWVRFAALPSSGAWQALISKFDNSTQKSYSFYVYNNAGTYQLYFTYTTNGSTNVNPVANGITVTTNTWYHYAVCRSGANLRMFIDGTQVGSTYNISTDSIFGGTYPVQVGASTASNVLNGFLQDTRVTKGYARYTANFTAPTAAFPTL